MALIHPCFLLGVSALSLVTACGDDPVSYSAPVGINLKAKSADTVNGVVSDEKGINTESGNPYGAFIGDASDALGGNDPTRIELDQLELLLGGDSTGVTAIGEIFEGPAEVLFIMNDSNNSFPVGSAEIAATTAGGPIAMSVSFDSDDVGGDDWDRLLGGSFKVVIRGDAAPEFASKGADADLQLTFHFAAFE